MSTCSTTKSSVTRSSSVSAAIGMSVSGTFTPLRSLSGHAPVRTASMATVASPRARSTVVQRPRMLPSSNRTRSPGLTCSTTSRGRTAMRFVSSTVVLSCACSVSVSPATSGIGPSAHTPVRTFGPARSMHTGMRRPAAAAAVRSASIDAFHCAASPCEALMRATSMPASISERMKSTLPAAHGGMVTMMRVMCGIGVSRSSLACRARSCAPSSIVMRARGESAAMPQIAASARSTASSVGITCASRRESDESPLRTSSACRREWSLARSAR